jgi:hypothetical protein
MASSAATGQVFEKIDRLFLPILAAHSLQGSYDEVSY